MIYIILISFIAGIISTLLVLVYLAKKEQKSPPEDVYETYDTLVIGEENIKDEKEITELAQDLLYRIKNFRNN